MNEGKCRSDLFDAVRVWKRNVLAWSDWGFLARFSELLGAGKCDVIEFV